ncbi:FAD-dependent oxidoreductase [Saccharopolyspora shandongensis]|uniref:NAD(P)/FAD-dependent oxidoreductase n=1 Tax=Saccharopolyspora shandongensis TaxID=418495 RepID=UPI0034244FA8
MRIVVVGGGVLGLCCALELSEAGADVVVLDRDAEPGGASMANAGWVVPVLSAPLAVPGIVASVAKQALRGRSPVAVGPRVTPDLLGWGAKFLRNANPKTHRDGLRALLALGARSTQQFGELAGRGVEFEMHRRGLVIAARTAAGLHEAFELAEAAERAGYAGAYDIHSGGSLRRLEPALADDVAGGVHARDEIHVRPESVVAGLHAALESRGVEVRRRVRVLGVERDGSRWSAVTSAGPERADRVVVAAGAWTGEILRGLGVAVPLQPGKGYSVTATGTGPAPRHAMKLLEANVACTPFAGGLRISGMFELAPGSAAVRERALRKVRREARKYLPGWRPAEPGTMLAGFRPSTPDSLPIIGPVPGADGVFAASGHGMLGLTLAPATAQALATLITTGSAPVDLAPFEVGRFGRRTGAAQVAARFEQGN